MASGGARLRSGPAPNPTSARSEKRGYKVSALPCMGYAGSAPSYPLSKFHVFFVDKDGAPIEEKKATSAFARREKTIWKWLWSTPQANAWSLPQYSYLLFDIALYCRQFVICEAADAKATDRALLPRYADRIGLSAAGMAALGWKISPDEVGARRNGIEEQIEEEQPVRRRMRG